MILDEYVKIKIGTRNFKHYKQLGYSFNHVGDVIMVVPQDLLPYSTVTINAKCDYCGKDTKVKFSDYMVQTKNLTRQYACNNQECMNQQRTNYFQQTYGVNNPFELDEIIQKSKETMMNKYGEPNAMKVSIFKKQAKHTSLEKWGYEYPSQSPVFRENVKNTCLKKYGVTTYSQTEDFLEQFKNTCQQKYGISAPMQNIDILQKAKESLYNKQNGICSVQQKYLHFLYGGENNYPFKYYSLDIYVPEYKLDIEYNGGGHNLSVKMREITEKEFVRKEIIRSTRLRIEGINQLTIISRKDYLPSDSTLLQMLEETLSYLSTTNYHWVEYDIDRSTVRNALDRFPYDFGALRKIKKTDVQDITQDIPEEAS